MTVPTRLSLEGEHHATPAETTAREQRVATKAYTAPRVDVIDVDALLEVLGPAQANYGRNGIP